MSLIRLVNWIKQFRFLYSLLILPYYFFRFLLFSVTGRSLWFYRYYPGHYGSTIPSAISIKRRESVLFKTEGNLNDGIDLNASFQEKLLKDITPLFNEFVPPKTTDPNKRYYYDNPMFGFNDGFILYAFMRLFKPNKVIEIGSGFSSALMIDTADEFLQKSSFTFIDPYSTNVNILLNGKTPVNHKIIREEVQDVKIACFQELGTNDILFIDSSHVLKIGSDLTTIMFSILPTLANGVIIHIHDMYYPFEYPQDMINEGRAWNEVYFVRSFLQYNKSFEILYFSSFVEKSHKSYINRHMPGFSCGSGTSLWLRKIS